MPIGAFGPDDDDRYADLGRGPAHRNASTFDDPHETADFLKRHAGSAH